MFEGDEEIIDLGRMAVFYLPIKKLRTPRDECRTHEQAIDEVLISRYEGVTKITQHVEGSYRMGSDIVPDDHIRYEVSFLGLDEVVQFVELIKQICRTLDEESIYLTMGEQSYLIQPKPQPT